MRKAPVIAFLDALIRAAEPRDAGLGRRQHGPGVASLRRKQHVELVVLAVVGLAGETECVDLAVEGHRDGRRRRPVQRGRVLLDPFGRRLA